VTPGGTVEPPAGVMVSEPPVLTVTSNDDWLLTITPNGTRHAVAADGSTTEKGSTVSGDTMIDAPP